jgi:hypothetical protein
MVIGTTLLKIREEEIQKAGCPHPSIGDQEGARKPPAAEFLRKYFHQPWAEPDRGRKHEVEVVG